MHAVSVRNLLLTDAFSAFSEKKKNNFIPFTTLNKNIANITVLFICNT